METVHNSGYICPYCHAFMYGHMNKNNIEAICPQCEFSFKGGCSMNFSESYLKEMEEIKKEIREWLNYAPLTQECNCSCYEELCDNADRYYHMKESIKNKLNLYFTESNSNYRVVTEKYKFENLRKEDAIDKALENRDCSSGDISISNNLQKIII